MHQLTVIVPLFNEEENLLRVEQKLGEYAENSSIPTQILLVNDGSTDNSLKMVREICERSEHFSYLSFTKNAGLSAAIKAGIDHVFTSLTGYIDSDLQTDPEVTSLLTTDQLVKCFSPDIHQENLEVIWNRLGL